MSRGQTVRKQAIKERMSKAEKIYLSIEEDIAKKRGLSQEQVHYVLYSIFKEIATIVRSGSLKERRIINLGTFKVKYFNILRYQRNNEDNTHGKR